MNSNLENLKILYPKLAWIDGKLYKSINHPSPLYTEEESLEFLLLHYTGFSITEQGFMNNPENDVTREAGAMEYILANFKDLEEAFNCA